MKTTEAGLGALLRFGVSLAGAVVLLGGVMLAARHGWEVPDYRTFRGEPAELREIRGIARMAFGGSARGIVQLGLLLLIATPVARVAFSTILFARERDWTFVGITLVVLALLAFSLSGGWLS